MSSELGIKSIKYNVQDGSDNTENSVNDPTVSGTTQTITTGISESGKTITIKEVVLKDAEHAVVDYNKTTCTAAESSSGDEAAQIIFTVTAEDGTIGTLTVTFETAG